MNAKPASPIEVDVQYRQTQIVVKKLFLLNAVFQNNFLHNFTLKFSDRIVILPTASFLQECYIQTPPPSPLPPPRLGTP